MKQQFQVNSYQQLGSRKKVDKSQDSNNKQSNGTYIHHSNNSGIADLNKNSQIKKPQNMISNQQIQQRSQKNGTITYNQAIQDILPNYQTRQIQENSSQLRCQTQPTSSPIYQTASKNKQSRSPSQKIGSQIKLQSSQLDNIQRQFNILLEKENKYLSSNSNNNSGNKITIQQRELQTGGSAGYLNPTKSNTNNRRQRNLTQLSINFNPSNNSVNKNSGSAKSLTKANSSLTPNSRKKSYSSHGAKRSMNSNFLQMSSGNQTTANISQKHYDFSSKQESQSGSKQISKSTKIVHQPQNQQLQSQNSINQSIQQSTQSINGEAINNKLITVIQKNPQSVEEYFIKDKQLNKLLQKLLQQRMQQQYQIQQQCQQSDQNIQNSQQGSKYMDNSASPTMSLMSSKPSTLQSYYAHLSLNNTSKQLGSQFQSNYNNQNSVFMNSSQQCQKQDSNILQNKLNNSNPITSYIHNNQVTQNIHNESPQQLQTQIQQKNMQNNNIFQEQLKIEDQFQQKYQQYIEKFQSYQAEKMNQKNNNKYSEGNGDQLGNIEVPLNISQNNQNQQDFLSEQKKVNDLKNYSQDKESNFKAYECQNSPDSNKDYYNRKQLLQADNNINLQNQYIINQGNSIEQTMVPNTINTETDSIQIMSIGERENIMKYIQDTQFPDYTSTNYQELIKDIPNDMHQEIIVLYEQKIKEVTEKFEHRDVIFRQSLMKLEKENSILLNRVKDQQEEIVRYKKLREMEVKLIKKLENEIKQEKTKYSKLIQLYITQQKIEKIMKRGNDKGVNNQIIEELNKKINELYSEKECLEYLLKDALLKTELLKAKESIIYRQVPFSNNLNTSTSTLSAGNQTALNLNQLNQYATNSNSNYNYQNPPIQTENLNLLSLDSSLNQPHNQQQQLQQQQDQLHQQQQQVLLMQQQQLIQNKQCLPNNQQQLQLQEKQFNQIQSQKLNQFQQLKQQQQQNQQQLLINQQMINQLDDNMKNPLDQSPDNNFLRMRNKSYDNQYGQSNSGFNEIGIDIQNYNQNYLQGFEQNQHQHEQEIVQNEINNQNPQQIHLFRKEQEEQGSERNNFMKTYQATTQGVNQSKENTESSHSNLSNYVLRKSNSNQNNENNSKLFNNQDNEQGVEQYTGSYLIRSSSQKQQNQCDEQQRNVYQNEQNQLLQDKKNDNVQKQKQQINIHQVDNDNNNLQTYDFTNINNQNNFLTPHPYQDIRNSQQFQGVESMNEIRSISNSNGNINTNFNNNYYDILICDQNAKSQNKPLFLNSSQVILEEGSSAGNTTQNNDNYLTCSNNQSIKNKISSSNIASSNAVEVNDNINQYNDLFYQKDDIQDDKNQKIFVQNDNFSKSNNIDQDEEIEAEFKDISESNRRRQQDNQQNDEDKIENQSSSVEVNQQTHEVLSQTEEYLKNKVDNMNNYNFNQQNVINQNTQKKVKQTQEQDPKYDEDESITNYYNTKNMYLQKYYASQNATASNNEMSKSLNTSNVAGEKNEKLNMSHSTK